MARIAISISSPGGIRLRVKIVLMEISSTIDVGLFFLCQKGLTILPVPVDAPQGIFQ